MIYLPRTGEWHLSNPLFGANPPFAVLNVDFVHDRGTVRYLKQTTLLTGITRLAHDKFRAAYAIGTNRGMFEAEYQDDQTLKMSFTGTVTTSCKARPMQLVGGERPISTWDTSEKLAEAIRRSVPRLPGQVRHEVEQLLTPTALGIMGVMVTAWGVSHFFGVGEIADVILLITGGIMLGPAALDVGRHLGGFVDKALGAVNDEDLDQAAEHFAGAVVKGGVQVVSTILLCKGVRAARAAAQKPVAPGQLPTELNAVPPSKIPAASRLPAALAEQGQQPRLAGLSEDVAAAVRAALNRIRKKDLTVETDCWGESLNLKKIAGAGVVEEGNATSAITRFDHTMLEIAGEYIDTRPGMWIKHFRQHPEIRAAIEAAKKGLADRLERGAVLTYEEFLLFKGKPAAPTGGPFNTAPIARGRPVPRPE